MFGSKRSYRKRDGLDWLTPKRRRTWSVEQHGLARCGGLSSDSTRYKLEHSWVPAETQEASQFVQAASYPLREVGIFRDWAPRAAVAWDVTGDAKTVAKIEKALAKKGQRV